MKFAVLLLAAILIAVSNATYLQVIAPVEATLHQNSSIYLGKVGPGESFYVEALASTTNATGTLINIGWDTLETTELPSGWSSQPSPYYLNPMKLKVTASPNAANGMYAIKIKAVNLQNYSRIGNLSITAYVNITPDVFAANVSNKILRSGIGQPVNVKIWLNNTGASDDPFVISSSGLPAFNLSFETVAKKGMPITLVYPVYENAPGVYPFNLSITSATSPLVHKAFKLELIVNSSVANDYAATGQGMLIFPIIYEPAYAFMLFLEKVAQAIR